MPLNLAGRPTLDLITERAPETGLKSQNPGQPRNPGRLR
jgi:hypothetical protein